MTRARTHSLAAALALLCALTASSPAAEGQKKPSLQKWQPSGQNIFDVSKQGETGQQGSVLADVITGAGTRPVQDFRQKLKEVTQNPNLTPAQRQALEQGQSLLQAIDQQSAAGQMPASLGKVDYGDSAPLGKSKPPQALPDLRKGPRPKDASAEPPFSQDLSAPIPRDLTRTGSAGGGVSPDLASGEPIRSQSAGAAAAPTIQWRSSKGFAPAPPAAPAGTSSPPGPEAARHMSLAEAQLRAGEPEKALLNADKAVQLSGSPEAYILRATIYEALKDEARKLADLEKAAALAPERHGERLRTARAGKRLFDPSTEGRDLLAAAHQAPGAEGKSPLMWLLPLAALGALLCLLVPLWRWMEERYRDELDRWAGILLLWSKSSGRWRAPAVNAPPPAPASPGPKEPPQRGPVMHIGGPHTPAQRLKQGQTLAGKYRLVRSLGCDGTMEAWRAHDLSLERPTLLKRLYLGSRSSDEGARRMEEARAAGNLHHPNVVDIYEILDLPTGLYVVYEHTPGKSLRQILHEKGTLSIEQVRDVLIPVCRALDHAHHRGVVHGGMSLERIQVTHQGYIQVSDFVLARTAGAGSEPYAAPEARRGEPKPVSDIYSLGMCFYELLTGSLPGQGDTEPDPRAADLLEKTLDLDYRTRLSSAREFLDILKTLSSRAVRPEDGKAPPEVRPEPAPAEARPEGPGTCNGIVPKEEQS